MDRKQRVLWKAAMKRPCPPCAYFIFAHAEKSSSSPKQNHVAFSSRARPLLCASQQTTTAAAPLPSVYLGLAPRLPDRWHVCLSVCPSIHPASRLLVSWALAVRPSVLSARMCIAAHGRTDGLFTSHGTGPLYMPRGRTDSLSRGRGAGLTAPCVLRGRRCSRGRSAARRTPERWRRRCTGRRSTAAGPRRSSKRRPTPTGRSARPTPGHWSSRERHAEQDIASLFGRRRQDPHFGSGRAAGRWSSRQRQAEDAFPGRVVSCREALRRVVQRNSKRMTLFEEGRPCFCFSGKNRRCSRASISSAAAGAFGAAAAPGRGGSRCR
jgi:hypothetical protein